MAEFAVHRVQEVTFKTNDFGAMPHAKAFRTLNITVKGENGFDTITLYTYDLNLNFPNVTPEG